MVLAVLSLASVALLMTVPVDRAALTGAGPGPSPGPEAAATMSGSLSVPSTTTDGDWIVVGASGLEGRATLRRGVVQQGITVESSDPRFMGEATITFNDERYGSAAAIGTIWGTHRIENADGAWSGTFIGGGIPRTLHARAMARYLGEGAFDGLAAIVFFDLSDRTFEGVIVPAALAPPQP